MSNQWRIEGTLASVATKDFVRECNADMLEKINDKIDNQTTQLQKDMTEDPREAVTLIGLTWAMMVQLVDDLRDFLDVDCPPLQTTMLEDDRREEIDG